MITAVVAAQWAPIPWSCRSPVAGPGDVVFDRVGRDGAALLVCAEVGQGEQVNAGAYVADEELG